MNKLILYITAGLLFFGCNLHSKDTTNPVKINFEIVNIPFHSIDSLYIENNMLIVDLVDHKKFNNPTVDLQSLKWYAFQLDLLNERFDSIKLNQTMPNRDSIITVYSNYISREDLKQFHKQLDNTLYGDFYSDFLKLNWRTRNNYTKRQTSLLDRTNSLFARYIDNSSFKQKFPNNDTWFGTDCFPIFEMYFKEKLENRKSIGHEIISVIEKSTKYFNNKDKSDLVKLIKEYSLKFEGYKKTPNKL